MTRKAGRTLAGAALGLCLVGLLITFAVTGRSSPQVSRQAVQAWQAQYLQPVIDGVGGLLVNQVKPAIDDFNSGKLTSARFESQAIGWGMTVHNVRSAFDRCRPGGQLRQIAAMYDTALSSYERAMQAFSAAGTSPDSQKAQAMSLAGSVGDAANSEWDRADTKLTSLLRMVGLPVGVPVTAQAPRGCPA